MKNINGFYPSKRKCNNNLTSASSPLHADTNTEISKPQPKSKLEIHGEFILDWQTLDSEAFKEYIIDIMVEASQRGRLISSSGERLKRDELDNGDD